MKKTIGIICGAALFIAASFSARAQTFIYDQQSTNSPSIFGDYLNIQEDSPLMQSFVPSLSAISFVQLEFWDIPDNGTAGATLYVNLWTGSPNTNSATLLGSTISVYMPNGFGDAIPGVTNFFFSTPITLTVGQTYYLQPVVQSGDNPWGVWNPGDTYPNGQLYGKTGGYFQPSTDLWFREGIIATPEPTTLALIGLGGILAFALRRRSKLFLLPLVGGLFLGSFSVQAADSIVQVAADIAELAPVSYADLPNGGTFFVLKPDGNGKLSSLPFPFLPGSYSSLPIYQVNGTTFLVDDTGGQLVTSSARQSRSLSANALAESQVESLSSFIDLLQFTNGGGAQTYQFTNTFAPIDTNGLWLEIHDEGTNVLAILHNTRDDAAYQLESTTNLANPGWTLGELTDGALGADETGFTPLPKAPAPTFYRAHHANAIMQFWNITDTVELNLTNTDGHAGSIGLQNGEYYLPTNAINVYYSVGGSAQNGIDYSNLPGVLTFVGGMRDTNIIIYPTARGLQPDKTIVLTLLQNSNYMIDLDYVSTTNTLYANPQSVPVANGDNERTCPNGSVTFRLHGQDVFNSSITYTIVTWPTHGTLDTNDIASASVTYTPDSCYEGKDSFTFTANNGYATSLPATVTMTTILPNANAAVGATVPGQSAYFNLYVTYSCPGSPSYVLPASLPHGSLDTNALPNVTYTATDTNFTGIQTFNYLAATPCGGAVTSSVTLYIASGPDIQVGCNPFGTGVYVPLQWALGTNEVQMLQRLGGFSDYKIYRSTAVNGPYTCILTNTDFDQTTGLDTHVVAGQTNFYTATFEFNNSSTGTTCETPFGNKIGVVVPAAYDLIAPDATWDAWDISPNHPKAWLHSLPAPFSSKYPDQYQDLIALPNTYWPPTTNGVPTVWSNNIVLVLPDDWTNATQLAPVKYSIAIDNDYWLYLNHSTNFIDAVTNLEGAAVWRSFKSFQDVAPGLLHGGSNTLSVVIRDRADINYFSMVVTTNACDP